MNTNIFTRVCKISLAACLALVLGTSLANAGYYSQGYGQNYQHQGYGYGQRSYSPSQHGGYGGGGYGGYNRQPQHCQPHYQPQPHYGQGGYGGYGRYR